MTIAQQLEDKLREHELQLQAEAQAEQQTADTPHKPIVTIVPNKPTQPPQLEDLQHGIHTFKTNMLTWANDQLKDNSSYLEIKEMKDLNSIVKDLEASTLKKDDTSGTTVNILVQNMLDKYHDDI